MPTMQGRTSSHARRDATAQSAGLDREITVPCNPEAPAVVRHRLRRLAGIGSAVGDAMLVASELVSNAVLHSGAGDGDLLRVELRRGRGSLLISVTDPGLAGTTAQVRPAQGPFGGMGLRLVEQLARRWGCDAAGGHRVWAELSVPS